MKYGRNFDFGRSFLNNMKNLSVVPHLAMVNSNSVNSEYTNQSQDNKDCYMLVTSGENENVCMEVGVNTVIFWVIVIWQRKVNIVMNVLI